MPAIYIYTEFGTISRVVATAFLGYFIVFLDIFVFCICFVFFVGGLVGRLLVLLAYVHC